MASRSVWTWPGTVAGMAAPPVAYDGEPSGPAVQVSCQVPPRSRVCGAVVVWFMHILQWWVCGALGAAGGSGACGDQALRRFSGFGAASASSCVYSCCGFRITSSAGPRSTISPLNMTRMSSEKWRAVARSWVM